MRSRSRSQTDSADVRAGRRPRARAGLGALDALAGAPEAALERFEPIFPSLVLTTTMRAAPIKVKVGAGRPQAADKVRPRCRETALSKPQLSKKRERPVRDGSRWDSPPANGADVTNRSAGTFARSRLGRPIRRRAERPTRSTEIGRGPAPVLPIRHNFRTESVRVFDQRSFGGCHTEPSLFHRR